MKEGEAYGLPWRLPADVVGTKNCDDSRGTEENDMNEPQAVAPSTISIDPAGAREIDDAIAVTSLGSLGWRVDVCIPDVPAVVRPGTRDDLAARADGLTRYSSGGRTWNMLPPATVEGLSLSPDEDRPMVHVSILVDRRLRASVESLSRLRHRTLAQLSYAEADVGMRDVGHALHEPLRAIWQLAMALHEERAAATGATFDVSGGTYTNEEGQTVRLGTGMAHPSNMAVMEIMILANTALAAWSRHAGKAVLYRNHRLPDFASGDRGAAAEELGEREGLGPATAARRLRGMTKDIGPAEMGTEPLGHHGLDLPAYAWFTSPLRRYCDVVNLRAALAEESESDLEGLARHLTEAHRDEKGRSSDHHAQSARSRMAGLLGSRHEKDLDRHDVHTILRSLRENPGFDQAAAMRLITARMAADSLSGRDIAMLEEEVQTLLGNEMRDTVAAWVSDSPARRLLLDEYRGVATPVQAKDDRNHKGRLQECAMSVRATLAFGVASRTGPPHSPVFDVIATWSAGDELVTARGAGRTLRAAEQEAARALIERLGLGTEGSIQRAAAPSSTTKGTGAAQVRTAKSRLMEWVQAHPGSTVVFGTASSNGPPHARTFSIGAVYEMAGETIQETGEGRTKKEAEQDASTRILAKLTVS